MASLSIVGLSWARIADQIDASTIAGDVEYRTSLPHDDVVPLPATNDGIGTPIHIFAITPVSAKRQIPNIRERETMSDVCVRTRVFELWSQRIVRTATLCTCTAAADATRGIVETMGPRV